MHERLGEVAAQLALHDVVLLGEAAGVARLDHRGGRHPAAAPDRGVLLVVAAPDVTALAGRDGVAPGAAEPAREHCVVVPARRAEEGEIALMAHQGPPFTIGDQRVLPQRPRRLDHAFHSLLPTLGQYPCPSAMMRDRKEFLPNLGGAAAAGAGRCATMGRHGATPSREDRP